MYGLRYNKYGVPWCERFWSVRFENIAKWTFCANVEARTNYSTKKAWDTSKNARTKSKRSCGKHEEDEHAGYEFDRKQNKFSKVSKVMSLSELFNIYYYIV